jgi:uncharacterized flavoprotein (TIGR03862 family)
MTKRAAILGAGPSGLIAAEILSANGWAVTIYDRMPSVGRKFLMAGRGGLNLTHSEPFNVFLMRYGAAAEWARPFLEGFGPEHLIAWAHGLGQETFVGSSGRVFPKAMKASPLLRAWLKRLAAQGVAFKLQHRWTGWDTGGSLTFEGRDGPVFDMPDATILAMGGGSWPKLGSDGKWAEKLRARGVPVSALTASNCGVRIAWSELFRTRFAGLPLNGVRVSAGDASVRGEAMIAQYGLEGGAIYALSAALRERFVRGEPELTIDLRPDMTAEALAARLDAPRRGDSASNFLRKRLSMAPVGINLLREAGADLTSDPIALARAIKSVTLTIGGFAGLERAISSVGGVAREALDGDLRIKGLGEVYAAGEMIDWDAPTGGYLLQLCFATGVHAARRICGL